MTPNDTEKTATQSIPFAVRESLFKSLFPDYDYITAFSIGPKETVVTFKRNFNNGGITYRFDTERLFSKRDSKHGEIVLD